MFCYIKVLQGKKSKFERHNFSILTEMNLQNLRNIGVDKNCFLKKILSTVIKKAAICRFLVHDNLLFNRAKAQRF